MLHRNYANRHALVLGLGESGLAMARWLAYCGAQVRVADTRGASAVAERLTILRAVAPESELIDTRVLMPELLADIDLIAVSPGLAPERELAALLPTAIQNHIPVWSEIELFAQALAILRQTQAYTPTIVAVTGTNGKTTVVNLTYRLCQYAGANACMAGNISPAALDVLYAALSCQQNLPVVWVLELSSFQLHTTYSLEADAAAVLNLTPDHLDWHGSMAHYIADKMRIFGKHTVQIVNRDDALVMNRVKSQVPHAKVISFGTDAPLEDGSFGVVNNRANGTSWLAQAKRNRIQRLLPMDELKIQGLHNASNVLAALALCHAIGLPMAAVIGGLHNYSGEPHRLELIATLAGVEYYNDSKATNVGATMAALHSLGYGHASKRLLLIAGGDGKGQDFAPLAKPLVQYCRAVFLIGRDSKHIRTAVADTSIPLIDCPTLPDAVRQANHIAQAGDAVLLSPACASFDMFENYAHRAQVFIAAVHEHAFAYGATI